MAQVYELEKTSTYRFQYSRLDLKKKRLVDAAIEEIKQTPTEAQGKITLLSGNSTNTEELSDAKKRALRRKQMKGEVIKEDKNKYRYRLPGLYIFYTVHAYEYRITLTQLRILR